MTPKLRGWVFVDPSSNRVDVTLRWVPEASCIDGENGPGLPTGDHPRRVDRVPMWRPTRSMRRRGKVEDQTDDRPPTGPPNRTRRRKIEIHF